MLCYASWCPSEDWEQSPCMVQPIGTELMQHPDLLKFGLEVSTCSQDQRHAAQVWKLWGIGCAKDRGVITGAGRDGSLVLPHSFFLSK